MQKNIHKAKTLTDIRQSLERLSKDPFFDNCRFIPDTFDPHDADLQALPRLRAGHWSSCQGTLAHLETRGVLLLLPAFWQVEPAVYRACRNVGAPIFASEPGNQPVAGESLCETPVDTVVAEAKVAGAFALYLLEHNIPLAKKWILIHQCDGGWTLPEPLKQDDVRVASEVHLFPGVPIFTQCPNLIEQNGGFHYSEEYIWEKDDSGTTYITSDSTEPFPFTCLKLSVDTKEYETCSCGKPVVKQNNAHI